MKLSMLPVMIFSGVFFLIGFAVLGYGLWSAYRSNQAAGWPTTEGTLTSVKLDEHGDEDGTTYRVLVEYSYAVAGKEYHASRLAFGYAGSNVKSEHEAIFDKLKNSRSVAVRYNPSDPATATLAYGLHHSIKAILTFAVVWLFLVAGLYLVVWVFLRDDRTLLDSLLVK